MPVDLSIVIPSRNEKDNVRPLVKLLESALETVVPRAEIIFVDDSDDETPDEVRSVSRTAGLPVRLEHRLPGQRHGRLAGAVTHGIRVASYDTVVVMDSDLQHRPQDIPALVKRLQTGGHDVVVGSRRVPGGSDAGLGGPYRKMVSRGASTTARIAFPRKVGPVRDVSSGFYVVRKQSLDLDKINQDGYKILLATLVHKKLSTAEEPIVFESRVAGESKATVSEGLRYLRLLAKLRMA